MRRASPVLLAVGVAALLGGCGGGRVEPAAKPAAKPAPRFAGTEQPAAARVPDFALRDQDGRLVRLSSFRGKLLVISFLYTHCQDICPLIAAELNSALRSLRPAQRARVRVLAISVDPAGDTQAAVRRYVRERRLLPEFRYLRGTTAQLAPVWQSFNVLVELRNDEHIRHGAFEYLLDGRAVPRLSYGPQVRATQVDHDLRLFLARGR